MHNVARIVVVLLLAENFGVLCNRLFFERRTRYARLVNRSAGEASNGNSVVHRRIFILGKFYIIVAVLTVFIEVIGGVACRRQNGKILDRKHYNRTCFAVLAPAASAVGLLCCNALCLCRLYVFGK